MAGAGPCASRRGAMQRGWAYGTWIVIGIFQRNFTFQRYFPEDCHFYNILSLELSSGFSAASSNGMRGAWPARPVGQAFVAGAVTGLYAYEAYGPSKNIDNTTNNNDNNDNTNNDDQRLIVCLVYYAMSRNMLCNTCMYAVCMHNTSVA